MVISAYQVNNVLRVYHDQLRYGKVSGRSENNITRTPDQVSISSDGKRKAVMDKIASSIADKISRSDIRNEAGKDVTGERSDEIVVKTDSSESDSVPLVYRIIDDQGETVNMLTIEDIKNSGTFGI